jgi:hypothetical protein
MLVFYSVRLFYAYKDKKSIQDNGVLTQATISELKKDNYGKYPSYTLYIEYTTSDSNTVKTEYRNSVDKNDYTLGEKLNIIYDKRNPRIFFFENDITIKNTKVFLVCDAIAICLLIVFKRRIFNYYQTE